MAGPDSLHARLKSKTRLDHAAVDAAFGHFDMRHRPGYAAFLRAHARVLFIAEATLRPKEMIADWVPRATALAADMAAMDVRQPPSLALPAVESDGMRWGMIYVLEGSRLGGMVLKRGLPDTMPGAYLSAEHAPGAWRALLERLNAHDGDAAFEADAARGASALFALYRLAAEQELAHV